MMLYQAMSDEESTFYSWLPREIILELVWWISQLFIAGIFQVSTQQQFSSHVNLQRPDKRTMEIEEYNTSDIQ